MEIHDLQEYAARIDRDEDDGRVAGELEPAGGVTGYRLDRKGAPRDYRGLALTLGPDNRSLVAIHPGGDPDPGRLDAAGPVPAAPPAGMEIK